jgi:hypothetical protein
MFLNNSFDDFSDLTENYSDFFIRNKNKISEKNIDI